MWSSPSLDSTARPARRVGDLRRVLLPGLAAALIAAAAPAGAARATASMDPAAFAADLQRISRLLASAPQEAVPRIDVPPVWTVEAGGQRFEVPAAWLRRDLDAARGDASAWPARRARLLAQLEALGREAEALGTAQAVRATPDEDDTARAALTRVLAGPEFKHMVRQSAMTRLRQRLTQWLVRMWERLGGGRLGGRGPALVFAWIVALSALGMLTAWLVRMILRQEGSVRLALTPSRARRRSARTWALEALKASDPREAARCAYRAAVCRLEEEGAWRADDTRTPREYLGLLSQDHRRRGLLAEVTHRFEEIWYGARPATEDDRRSLLIRLKELGCLPAD
jgi:hypothetical protein